jgi:hypothetical protein
MILLPHTTAAYPGMPALIMSTKARLVIFTGSPFWPVSSLIQLGSSVMPPQLPIIMAAATIMPTIVERRKLGPKTSATEPGFCALAEIHRADSGTRLRTNRTHNAGKNPKARTQRQL